MTKPLLHFAHANSYPAGTYRQYFDHLRDTFEIAALDMHGHDPRFPVDDGWRTLADELIHTLEGYGEKVVLVGHSLGGMLSLMVGAERPELVRCVVMLDSPVVAGWRALFWRFLKYSPWSDRFTPARFSAKRRNVWPDRETAYRHFSGKGIFGAWAPGVLDDYLEHGLKPHPDGVQLRFTREVETAVYRSLPHHLGKLLRKPYPVPIGFIGGTGSVECRQAGLEATRAIVKDNFVQLPGGHLFPMEDPKAAADATKAMVSRLLLD